MAPAAAAGGVLVLGPAGAPAAAPTPAPAPAPAAPALALSGSGGVLTLGVPPPPAFVGGGVLTLTPEAAPTKCPRSSDPGNLLEPASWTLTWSLDGGKAATLGPFEGSVAPAQIKLDRLADARKGEHFVELQITVNAGSASVSGAGAQPPAPLVVSRKIFFDLVDAADAPNPNGPPPDAAAVAGGAAGAGGAAADAVADSVAVKYYCALNFNVGGAIKRNISVERAPEDGPLSPGAFPCARACNRMGPDCAAFGVVAGSSCFLMGSVNASAGGADSLVTAVCMKNMQDWVSLGAARGVNVARDKYFCLPTFDVQGWPAGQGPDRDEWGSPSKLPTTDFPANTEPTICAGQCSTTQGCEFFVQTVPSGCYLKGRPFDSDSP
ncbi:MAG: hypothetical protein J3K34DRAFT_210867 [Monoraphidium minutum]|nr:MAG: hypothetical protein J3K34DRAFT_210867 [Monoraphidium minutum]